MSDEVKAIVADVDMLLLVDCQLTMLTAYNIVNRSHNCHIHLNWTLIILYRWNVLYITLISSLVFNLNFLNLISHSLLTNVEQYLILTTMCCFDSAKDYRIWISELHEGCLYEPKINRRIHSVEVHKCQIPKMRHYEVFLVVAWDSFIHVLNHYGPHKNIDAITTQ